MRRVALAVVGSCVVAAAVIGVGSPANAADNRRISGDYAFTATRLCVDPIHVEGTYDEMMHAYYDANGDAIRLSFTGTVTVKYTDLVSHNTFSPNSSGPGTTDLATGQTIVRGSNGTIFTDEGVLATNGRIVFDADGNIISITGKQTGVCEALGTTDAP